MIYNGGDDMQIAGEGRVRHRLNKVVKMKTLD